MRNNPTQALLDNASNRRASEMLAEHCETRDRISPIFNRRIRKIADMIRNTPTNVVPMRRKRRDNLA